MFHRRQTLEIKIGESLTIGGNDRVVMQSMCTTKTEDVEATVAQIKRLITAGCQLVRLAVPNEEAALAISSIKERVDVPLVADIHFDYRLACQAIKNGISKIRINPGNIGNRHKVAEVVSLAKEYNIPIRIGVNAGSLEKKIIQKYGYPTADGMLESAFYHINILEQLGFTSTVVSLKASDVMLSIQAYQKAAEAFNYPLHLGITEAGTPFAGTIKSVAGMSVLLAQGIGSTIRVSLTADPVEEIKVGRELLKSFGLADNVPTLIACPTCGRIEIDLISLANEVEEYLSNIHVPIKVAVLGCAVNGPGEAKEADIGIAGARGEGLLFRKGKIVRKIPEGQLLTTLKMEIDKWVKDYQDQKKSLVATK